jgi:signal transduction histidine kinase
MAKVNIMIVEDEAIVGEELKISLEDMGYTVTSIVKSGEQAIEKAEQDCPDLILMDIRLKGQMDGIEAGELIRSRLGIPVVFLTAYADDDKLERAKLTMPFGYILKPFQDRDLEVTIEIALYTAKIDAKRKRAEEKLKESRQQLQNLSSQLIEIQEKERKRISLELHDGLGQTLIAIQLNLKEIEEELFPELDSTIGERLADIYSVIEEASEQVSELSLDLRPSLLDDLGLVSTLRWFINRISKRANMEVKFVTMEMDERLDPNIETVLYRISQEALNNIIKHADATNVMVRLERKQESIALYIKDDGKGFDVEETLADQLKGRIGLIGMQERASIMRGSLSIQSSKGHGTVILAEMPVRIED